MKKVFFLLIGIISYVISFSQQIAFKPTDEFSYQKNKIQLGYPLLFTEDLNNDGIQDYYAYLSKGYVGDSDTTLFDLTIDEGYYCVIRNADGSIRAKRKLKEINVLGPCMLADFNNDGKKDLLCVSHDTMSILYRMDSINHVEKIIATGKGFFSSYNIVKDINKDGLLDIVSSYVTFKNQFYIFYQMSGDSFKLDTLQNPIQANIYGSEKSARLKIGDFNSDGKYDFLVYSFTYYYRLNFYIQQDSGKFTTMYKGLPNKLNSVAVLDYNHDSRDDIVVEVSDFNDSLRIISIPQTINGITSLQYTYNVRDNYGGNNADDRRLTATDLNCDGYPELIRYADNCDTRCYIYETRYDTTFSNSIPLNLSQKIGVQNFEGLGDNFFDYNGDNRVDLLGAFTIKDKFQKRKFMTFKNISINDQTSLTPLSWITDTLDEIIPRSCNEIFSIPFFETYKYDTSYKWQEFGGTIINPTTGKYAYPAWVKYKIISKYSVFGKLLPKCIYEDTLFKTNGNVCGKPLQDTLRRRVLKNKYIEKKVIDTTIQNQTLPIDTVFSNPMSMEIIKAENINIYPIPANDKLHLEIPILTYGTIEFFDNLFNQLAIKTIEKDVFDVSRLNAGLYFIRIRTDNQYLIKKFIVEH